MKKYLSRTIAVLYIFMFLCSLPACVVANSSTWPGVQNIISGNQDCLVLATINEKGTSAYEVEVIHEIGAVPATDTETTEIDETVQSETIVQKDIYVEGLTSYMYYDNYDYQPKKGDNVLLSLTLNGNVYSVKNGAFKIDYADIDNFNFIIPEGAGSDVIAELSALYVYVDSDGKRGDVFVQDNKVYGTNADGKQEEIFGVFGIKFIDEFGDTTENEEGDYGSVAVNQISSNAWIRAVIIIISGIVLGVVFAQIVSKMGKRRS